MDIVQHAPMQKRNVFSLSLYGVYWVMGVCFEDTQTQHECMSTALAELGSGAHALQDWKHWNSYKNVNFVQQYAASHVEQSRSLDLCLPPFRLFGPAD
jgi:hypothetical protein